MKKIVLLILICAPSLGAFAQNAAGTAQQPVQLGLSNALDITFTGSGTANGGTVNMAFNNVNDYANGVESSQQELKVRSNKNFKVSVNLDYNSFAYTGTTALNLANVPLNAFGLKVVANTTGGNIASPFSSTGFAALIGTQQDVIINGANGGDQRFAVKYKCAPGFTLPGGTYSFNVIYTATQQ